jgi:hypothetical protein
MQRYPKSVLWQSLTTAPCSWKQKGESISEKHLLHSIVVPGMNALLVFEDDHGPTQRSPMILVGQSRLTIHYVTPGLSLEIQLSPVIR